MELQKRLELPLLVRVRLVDAEDVVEQLRDGVCDRGCGKKVLGLDQGGLEVRGGHAPKRYIRVRTTGAQRAPMARP